MTSESVVSFPWHNKKRDARQHRVTQCKMTSDHMTAKLEVKQATKKKHTDRQTVVNNTSADLHSLLGPWPEKGKILILPKLSFLIYYAHRL